MLRKNKQINMLNGNLRGYRRIKNDFFPLLFVYYSLLFLYCISLGGNFFFIQCEMTTGFLSGSAGKESACNVGDVGSIPRSKRSPGERNGNPLQYSCLGYPLTEEPGGLQTMGSQSVGHNLATKPKMSI